MKIIGISNFDNDSISDILICENICEGYDKAIINFFNDRADHQTYFFKIVADDYKLYKFEP